MKVCGGMNLKIGLAYMLTLAAFAHCAGAISSGMAAAAEIETEATVSPVVLGSTTAGVTPFIASVQLTGTRISKITKVSYTITPKANAVSAALKVTWTMTALANRGYVKGTAINLPVAGLYADYANTVSYELTFSDGSTQKLRNTITTAVYTDTTGLYLNPRIVKARAPGSKLGYNFMYIKSRVASPVIVDTDAEVRWVVPGVSSTEAQIFQNGEFVLGSADKSIVYLLQLDGTKKTLPVSLPQPLLGSFTHNLDPGPHGILAEFNGTDSLGGSVDDIAAEISPFTTTAPDQIYDMAAIISNYMSKNGDDPTKFVRPGRDWFHLNSAVYDPSDQSVILSSRENFLIKVGYKTHEIIWIFGDPTKYWYTFPSLKAKAITLTGGGLYPIGQHGVTFTSDGHLMVFNNGFQSQNQPNGAPRGVNLSYSAVSVYTIDAKNMSAIVNWKFDYGQKLLSQICGNSYEAGNSYLVDFAATYGWHRARLVGIDSSQNVAFDFEYMSPDSCGTAWNAIPAPFEDLQITN